MIRIVDTTIATINATIKIADTVLRIVGATTPIVDATIKCKIGRHVK